MTSIVVLLAASAVVLVLAPGVARSGARRPGAEGDLRIRRASSLDLVDVIERVTREVRSGRSLRDSLTDTLDAAPSVLPEVAMALARHSTVPDAIDAHAPRGDERDLLAHALRLGVQHTHVLADVLDRTNTVVRERHAWRCERVAQAAQARLSARVLTVLPLAFAAWGVATSVSVRDAYGSSPVTVTIAGFGICLNVAGWLWMRRVVGVRS